jgi:dTDP-4-amino-4,6-dideoxygalactose transaminase
VHLGGSSPDMSKIFKLSRIYNFKILEDASHSLGGSYLSNPIGSCKYSDVCVFSFHPVKIITTGEGGMFLTRKYKYFNKAKELRSHGIVKNKKTVFLNNQIWNYQQIELGLNLRMSDIQASLGLSQLSRLKSFINRRNQIAQIYNKAIKHLPLIRQKILDMSRSSYHLYIVKLDKSKTSKSRNEFYKFLKRKSIEANFHYIPVYKHPYYRKNKLFNSLLNNSEEYFDNAISLPMHTKLTQKDIFYIINCMKSFFKI